MKLMKCQHLSPMRIAKMKTAYYCLMVERVKGNGSHYSCWWDSNLVHSLGGNLETFIEMLSVYIQI